MLQPESPGWQVEIRLDFKKTYSAVQKLKKKKIIVSAFIDPEIKQVVAAAMAGCPCIELHTGAYANATTVAARKKELKRQRSAAQVAKALGMQVNAGHGLHYNNLARYLKAVPYLDTLNIGHAIVSRAMTVGFEKATREMISIIRRVK